MSLLVLLLGCPCGSIGLMAMVGGLVFLKYRCPNCRRLPLASRADCGWPDFDVDVCPYCGVARQS